MPETRTKLAGLLDEAIRLDKVEKGNIQAFDPVTKTLTIVSQSGFDEAFLRHFKTVRPFDSSACGRAFGSGDCVVIPDVEHDEAFAPHREVARRNGVRSVKSVPVKDAEGRLLGVLSTHSADARRDWDRRSTVEVASKIAPLLAKLRPAPNPRG